MGRHRSPTVLYMPRLEELEEALQLRVGTGLDRLLGMLPRWAPLLVVLTSVQPYQTLVEQHRAALATAHLHRVVRPGQTQRTAFFTTLLSHGETRSTRQAELHAASGGYRSSLELNAGLKLSHNISAECKSLLLW